MGPAPNAYAPSCYIPSLFAKETGDKYRCNILQMIYFISNPPVYNSNCMILTYYEKKINTRFLLILSGDIEKNPGPENTELNICPCKQRVNCKSIKCTECKQIWHSKCVALGDLTPGAMEKLSWVCVLCMEYPEAIKKKLKASLGITESNQSDSVLLDKLNKMEENLISKISENQLSQEKATSPQYKEAAIKNLQKSVHDTNKLVRNQLHPKEDREKEKKEINKKTRVVLKPMDIEIRNSKDLRKQFNKYFPRVYVEHAFITAGGSYIFQFENEEMANQIQQKWDNTYFKGNSGLVNIKERNCTGIVKYVYDLEEDEIKNEIEQNYPNTEVEFFRKNDEFTGMLKVTFKDENELKKAIAEKFTLYHRKYITEEFVHKPRVIKCNTCQVFGHVSRLCRSKKTVCGKCCENHETKDCTSPPSEYKCFHCNKTDHITGSHKCEKIKEKYQILADRQDG